MTKANMKHICILFAALSALAIVSRADDQCELKGYNIQPLTNILWGVNIDKAFCMNTTDRCFFVFGVCHEPVSLCPDGAYACRLENGNSTKLGGKPQISERTGSEGVEFRYKLDGDKDGAVIEFTCDANAKLKSEPDYQMGKFANPEVTKTDHGLRITVKSEIGCKKREGLGPGSQLMLVLLVLFLLYFCGGMVYNHVNGARGIELIPHHWFWKNLPSLVVDGCIFCVRAITCQTRENYPQNPDYGATSPGGLAPSGRNYETL